MIRRVLFGCSLSYLVGVTSACSGTGGEAGPPDAASGTGGASSATGGAKATGGGTGTGGDSASGGSTGGAAGKAAGGKAGATGGVTGGATGGVTGGATGGVGGSRSGGSASGGTRTGGAGGKIAVKDLPIIKEMPDPLTMNDGTKVTTPAQWTARRQEMIKLLEDWEYGHMPPPPGNVKAATISAAKRVSAGNGLQADFRSVHITFGPGDKLGFDIGLFTPVDPPAGKEKNAVLINLTFNANDKSISDAAPAFARGYAVASVGYQQLGADSSSWASSAFFPSYPDYDWRDISAWAWGLSRAVDYLVTDPAIDPTKIMTSGVSRLAQAVLLAGAFDERIALSAPVAGGSAMRFSGKELGGSMSLGQGITEIVDQNTFWFGPRFQEFRNQTPRLPTDQHWLPALTAPRLFVMCNSLKDQYGRAYAVVQTYQAAKPVYDFLGVPDNIGVGFRPGGHGIQAEDWATILDFADQFLMKKGGTRKFDVIPPASQLP